VNTSGYQSFESSAIDFGDCEGKAQYAVNEESERLQLRDTLKPASRRTSMLSRMGREKVRE